MDQFEKRDHLYQAVSADGDPYHRPGNGQEGHTLPSLFARILPLLFEPTKLFRALREQPVFWGAMFLGASLVAFSGILLPAELYEETMRREIESSEQEFPGGSEEFISTAASFARFGAAPGAFVGFPIMVAAMAGLFTLIFRFGMGYEGSYRQYLSIVAHCFLVTAMGAVLLTPLKIAAGRIDVSLSLGAFLSNAGDSFLGRFLQGVDLLNLWVFALIGLGIAVVDGTRPARTAIGVSLGILLLFVAAMAGIGGQ